MDPDIHYSAHKTLFWAEWIHYTLYTLFS